MNDLTIRCRHCGWGIALHPERIPSYGARARCSECGGLQLVEAVPVAPQRPAVEPWPASVRKEKASITEPRPASAEVARAEARQLVQLWLRELAQAADEPLSGAHVFSKFGDELAHLFALWQTTFPGREAAAIFREQLLAALNEASGEPHQPAGHRPPANP